MSDVSSPTNRESVYSTYSLSSYEGSRLGSTSGSEPSTAKSEQRSPVESVSPALSSGIASEHAVSEENAGLYSEEEGEVYVVERRVRFRKRDSIMEAEKLSELSEIEDQRTGSSSGYSHAEEESENERIGSSADDQADQDSQSDTGLSSPVSSASTYAERTPSPRTRAHESARLAALCMFSTVMNRSDQSRPDTRLTRAPPLARLTPDCPNPYSSLQSPSTDSPHSSSLLVPRHDS